MRLTPETTAIVQQMLEQKGRGLVQLHTLYQVHICGSMYAAIGPLGLSSISAVRKRLYTLQKKLQIQLLTSGNGWSELTELGMQVSRLVSPEFEKPNGHGVQPDAQRS